MSRHSSLTFYGATDTFALTRLPVDTVLSVACRITGPGSSIDRFRLEVYIRRFALFSYICFHTTGSSSCTRLSSAIYTNHNSMEG